MKLIEHLDFVIGLVDRSAPTGQIKGALLAMREQVEGQTQATEQYSALAKAKAKVDEELSELKAEIARRDSDDSTGFSGFPPPSGVL